GMNVRNRRGRAERCQNRRGGDRLLRRYRGRKPDQHQQDKWAASHSVLLAQRPTSRSGSCYCHGSENFGSFRNVPSVRVLRNEIIAVFSDAVKFIGCTRTSLFGCCFPPVL